MGQKINPVSLRLETTNRQFDNSWYSNFFYKNLINKDICLQNYFNNFLKLLKLPTGRYSIQHLQKKTQVYTFFCNSKATREWRANLFGLRKKRNISRKKRFFFKTQTKEKKHFNKKRKHTKKLIPFYNAVNQKVIYKIQKRITSFQNYRLWSRLFLTSFPTKSGISLNYLLCSKLRKFSKDFSPQRETKISLNFFTKNPIEFNQQAFLVEKRDPSILKNNKNLTLESGGWLNKDINGSFLNEKSLDFSFLTQHEIVDLWHSEFKSSIDFLFLQNLFFYKILKSRVKTKNRNSVHNRDFSKKDKNTSLLLLNQHLLKSNLENPKIAYDTLDFKYNNYLGSRMSKLYNLQLDLIPFKVKNDWQYAQYLAEEIAFFLEKRIPFRRIKNKLLKQLSKISAIRGVRITCSGRVGGKSKKAQRAKTESLKYGQTSLQVFSSKIDFSMKTAFTSFGSVGIKVWVCYF